MAHREKSPLKTTSGFFPPQYRVQKLLSHGGYVGVTSEVREEGSFIQLTANGSPLRQVFIGITETEFVLVKQEIDEASTDGMTDPELSGLVVDLVLPLADLRFFIIDDGAKRFTVCTCQGDMFHFEMCQMDLYYEAFWVKWRAILVQLSSDSRHSFGLKHWHTSCLIDIANIYESSLDVKQNTLGDSDLKTLYFIQHPHSFHQVRSIGVQTATDDKTAISKLKSPKYELDESKKYTSARCENIQTVNNANCPKAEPCLSCSDMSDYSATSSSDDMYSEPKTNADNGSRPCQRLDIFYSGYNPIVANSAKTKTTTLRRSVSWSDLSQREALTELKKDTASLLISSLNKLLKYRKRLTTTCASNRKRLTTTCTSKALYLSSGSDSDAEIDEVFNSVEEKLDSVGRRSGKELWNIAKRLVLQKNVDSFLERLFRRVVDRVKFQAISDRRKGVPLHITQFTATDVAMELLAVSKKIFLSITAAEIYQYKTAKRKYLPKTIHLALTFGNDISRMVATEILSCKDVSDRMTTIKFFIQVCLNLLFEHSDFQSLTAILRGLTSLPVYRLDNTWATFFVQEPLSFSQFLCLVQIISPKTGIASYVGRVNVCRARNKPFIPGLDHILLHCEIHSTTAGENPNAKYEASVETHHVSCDEHIQIRPNQLHNRILTKEKTRDEKKKTTYKEHEFLATNIIEDNRCKSMPNIQNVDEVSKVIVPKSILGKKVKRHKSFFKIKQRKHVRFCIEDDKHGIGNKKRNDSLKHMAKTRIKEKSKIFNLDIDKIDESSTDSELEDGGEDDVLPLWKGGYASSNMSVDYAVAKPSPSKQNYSVISIPPSVIHYCHVQAKTILDDAIRLVMSSGMLAALSEDSNTASGSSSASSVEDDCGSSSDNVDHNTVRRDGHVAKEQNRPESIKQDNKLKEETSKNDKKKQNKVKKTKPQKPEKKLNVRKKGNKLSIFQKIKYKIRNSKKSETEYVKSLEREINAIQAMLSDIKPFDDDDDTSDETERKPISQKVYMEPNKTLKNRATTSTLSNEDLTQSRTSYRSALTNRRKSLFGEAIENHESESEEDKKFDALKNAKLSQMKRRGSLAFDLLASNDDLFFVNNILSSDNLGLLSVSDGNESNNSKERMLEAQNGQNAISVHGNVIGVRLPALTHSLSTERLKSTTRTFNSCILCDKKTCIYANDMPTELLNLQKEVIKVTARSKERVKACIQRILKINGYLSSRDVLQISFSLE